MVGGGGWQPTLGEWTWCHCWVPLQGANFCFISSLFSGPPISPRHPRKQQWNLSWASCKRHTVLYIDNTKIGFGYLGSMLVLNFLKSNFRQLFIVYLVFSTAFIVYPWFWFEQVSTFSQSCLRIVFIVSVFFSGISCFTDSHFLHIFFSVTFSYFFRMLRFMKSKTVLLQATEVCISMTLYGSSWCWAPNQRVLFPYFAPIFATTLIWPVMVWVVWLYMT